MPQSADPLAPKSSATPPLTGPLACVTLCGRDAAAMVAFYRDFAGLTVLAEHRPDAAERLQKAALWGAPDGFDWQEIILHNPATPEVPKLRLIISDQAGDDIRPDMDALFEGGLSVGFATTDQQAAMDRGAALGIGTTAGLTSLPMVRADGSAYEATEAHFIAPNNVYALTVGRPPDLAPVGPVAPGALIGGPAYSCQIINHGDPCLDFYTEVLGYEARRKVTVTSSGPEGGLGLPPQTDMVFMQVFAPGSVSGYLVFLDFMQAGKANPRPLGLPSSGLVMWSFPVRDLDAVLDRAAKHGAVLKAGPVTLDDAALGSVRVATLLAPNGFPVEVYEA